jgi:hypothetical protein
MLDVLELPNTPWTIDTNSHPRQLLAILVFLEKSKHLLFNKEYQLGSLRGFGFDCRKCYIASNKSCY